MRFELFIARRYLKARRKQVVISFITVISVLGVMTGVAALIIILSMYAGMSLDLQGKILGATAHITVLPRGAGGLAGYRELGAAVAAVPGVRAVTPAVYVQALASSGTASAGLVLKGVDPAAEARLAGSLGVLRTGRFEALAGRRTVILGAELAKSLDAAAGAPITLIVPKGTLTPLGLMPRIHRYRVVGTFESGLFDLDNTWAFISLDEARALAGLPADTVQALEVRVHDIYAVPAIQAEIGRRLGERAGLTNWIETNRPLFAALQLEKWGMFLAIGLIVLVASLNIVTTLILMVMEKSRDIAILRAMGATERQIMRVFVWQGMIIGCIGTLLGAALGVGLAWAGDHYKWIRLDAAVYSIPYLPFRISSWDVLLVAGAALLISFLATLYPSRQAARLNPVEAIRYE
jgi:lipoprotein-releasing system permease protein